jgi:hypothetical protein
VTATNPQPDDPRRGGPGDGPAELKRGGRTVLLVFLLLIVIAAIAVALSNLGGDDDPSGGGEQGLGPAVTAELSSAV